MPRGGNGMQHGEWLLEACSDGNDSAAGNLVLNAVCCTPAQGCCHVLPVEV